MNADDFAEDASDYFANSARAVFFEDYERAAKCCESEIERIFLAALIAVLPTLRDMHTLFASSRTPAGTMDIAFGRILGLPRLLMTYIRPQAVIGRYRVDFLVVVCGHSGKRVQIVVECDGHDYHERTPEQAARDRKRDRDLQALGFRVMWFTGSEICRDPYACAQEVRKAVLHLEADEAGIADPPLGERLRGMLAEDGGAAS